MRLEKPYSVLFLGVERKGFKSMNGFGVNFRRKSYETRICDSDPFTPGSSNSPCRRRRGHVHLREEVVFVVAAKRVVLIPGGGGVDRRLAGYLNYVKNAGLTKVGARPTGFVQPRCGVRGPPRGDHRGGRRRAPLAAPTIKLADAGVRSSPTVWFNMKKGLHEILASSRKDPGSCTAPLSRRRSPFKWRERSRKRRPRRGRGTLRLRALIWVCQSATAKETTPRSSDSSSRQMNADPSRSYPMIFSPLGTKQRVRNFAI